MKLLYRLYTYFFIAPCLLLSFLILIIAIPVTILITRNPGLASRIFAVGWARFNSFISMMKVKVFNRHLINEKQSYVIVSNHHSLYDIYVLYGWLGIDFKWVMKKELRKAPFLGYLCEKLDHIYIDRSDSESAIRTINEAKKKITNGTSILFFPEGTRSATAEMGIFKKGAFKFAIDMGLPILPITINGTREILAKGSLDLHPGKVNMIFHEPISTANYTDETIEELMDNVREVMIGSIFS